MGQASNDSRKEWSPLTIVVGSFLFLIGSFLFLVGSVKRLPAPLDLASLDGPWRLALLAMGAIVIVLGAFLILKNTVRQATSPMPEAGRNFVGRYYAETDRSEVNVIKHLSGDCFAVENPDWDGVGILKDSIYFGVYRYKETGKYAANRGKRGMHKLDLRFERGGWSVRVEGADATEVAGNCDSFRPWGERYTWYKVEDTAADD